jgi:nucleoside-diphosphate-sugar epimerase
MRRLTHLKSSVYCLTPNEFLSSNLFVGTIYYCLGVTGDFGSRIVETVESHVSTLAKIANTGRFKKIVYLSSSRVYGQSNSTVESEGIKFQNIEFSNLYDFSKLMGECILYQKEFFEKSVILRLSNVVGENQPITTAIGQMLEGARSGKIKLKDTFEFGRDYVCLSDVVSVLVNIGKLKEGNTYNVSTNSIITNENILDWLNEKFSFSVEIEENPRNVKSVLPVNNLKIIEELGIQFREPKIEIINQIWR